MAQHDSLIECLRDVHEIEEFCHRFIGHLTTVRPKAGEDVTRHAGELGLEVPALLKGAHITWDSPEKAEPGAAAGKVQTLVLMRPGNAEALGLTLGCIRIGRFRICLECGVFYCRVVIKGTFAH